MFKRITKETFDQAFPVMEEAFPISELREKDGQKAILDDPCYRLYGITEEGDTIQGIIGFWEIEEFIFLEHFAIRPGFRNGGFGGKKLDEFIAWGNKPLVLEVEPPEDELKKRRIGFYERHGLYLNEYLHVQPPLRKGQPLLPLRLMTSQGKIGKETFQRYKRLLNKIVYHNEGV